MMYHYGDPWTIGPVLHLVCRKVHFPWGILVPSIQIMGHFLMSMLCLESCIRLVRRIPGFLLLEAKNKRKWDTV